MNTTSRLLGGRVAVSSPSSSTASKLRGPLMVGLTLAGAGIFLIALRLNTFLARYDTLGYLLAESGRQQRALMEGCLLGVAVVFWILAGFAVKNPRIALTFFGFGLLTGGSLSGPLFRTFLAETQGVQESLVYRLRGLTATGVVGGAFILFLAMIPFILSSPPGRMEVRCRARLRQWGEQMLSQTAALRGAAVACLAFLVLTGVGLGVLSDFPNSSDENSYLTQARIFASGRLWVDAPAHPEAFRARSMILDEESGRFFAKAFPGWAAILSLGVRAGIPWGVNPLLAALTLVLAGWVGREVLGKWGEIAVIALMALTPFFILNSASYFNHPVTLFFVTLFLVSVIRLSHGGGFSWALVAGAATAGALASRPVSAVALTLPFIVWLGIGWLREGNWKRPIGFSLPVLLVLILLSVHNHLLYGSAWRTGYQAYDPADIGIGLSSDHLAITGWWLLKLCLWTLPGSLAGLYFLLRRRRLGAWFGEQPLQVLMGFSLLLLGLVYLLLQNKGGNEYGPRYYYDGFLYLTVLMVAGWMRAPRVLTERMPEERARRGISLALGFGAVLALIASIPFLLAHYRDKVEHNRDLYVTVERAGLTNALVFLETGSGRMPPGDLVRNPIDFMGGVLYARDRGREANLALASLHPDRPALVYRYDPYRRSSVLRPLREGAGARP